MAAFWLQQSGAQLLAPFYMYMSVPVTLPQEVSKSYSVIVTIPSESDSGGCNHSQNKSELCVKSKKRRYFWEMTRDPPLLLSIMLGDNQARTGTTASSF